MTRLLSNRFTQFIAILGGIISLILTVKHYQPDLDLLCGPAVGGCKGVLNSQYGHIGFFPTALLGFGMYAALFVLCVWRGRELRTIRKEETARAAAYAVSAAPVSDAGDAEAFGSETAAPVMSETDAFASPTGTTELAGRAPLRRLDLALWGIALLGFGISWWLQYTAFFTLKSFCPYCFSSALLITLIFGLATRDAWIDGRSLTGEQKLLVAILGVIAVLVGVTGVVPLHDQWIAIHQIDDKPANVSKEGTRDILIKPDLHWRGSPNAKYTLIEFADYMCPSCKYASHYMDELVQKHPDKYRFAFRNFPLPRDDHKWSSLAAEAAEAAGAQGKFWEMHDHLFAHQTDMENAKFSAEDFTLFAQAYGLDAARFKKAMLDGAYAARVQDDKDAGSRCGVMMTPTIFFISPTQVWRFAGVKELQPALEDPTHPMWK